MQGTLSQVASNLALGYRKERDTERPLRIKLKRRWHRERKITADQLLHRYMVSYTGICRRIGKKDTTNQLLLYAL